MGTDIKILLASDLHLGLNLIDPAIPKRTRLNTFKKITTLALEHDLLLFSGDMLDVDRADDDLLKQIKYEFKGLRENEVEIIYTPGLSEMKGKDVSEILFDLGATLVFSEYDSKPYHYVKDGSDLYIYGSPPSPKFDITRTKKINDRGFHIGLFHIDFDLDSNPVKKNLYRLPKNAIKSLSLDFYALGSSHIFRMFKVMNRIIGAYPGSPEPASIEETGDRYAISMTIRDNEIHHIRRLSVNSIKINETVINCTEYQSTDEIIDVILQEESKKVIEVVTLLGVRDFPIDLERIKHLSERFQDIKISDRSTASIKSYLSEFKDENSIRGEFYKLLMEKIGEGDIPQGVNLEDIASIMNRIEHDSPEQLEEWLCGS